MGSTTQAHETERTDKDNQQIARRTDIKPKPATAPLVWRKRYSLIYQPPLYNPVYFNLLNKPPITLSHVRPISHAYTKAPMSYEHTTAPHSYQFNHQANSHQPAPSSAPVISTTRPMPVEDDDDVGWSDWNEESADLFSEYVPYLSHNQPLKPGTQTINLSNKTQQIRKKPVSSLRSRQRQHVYSYPSTEIIKGMTSHPINTLFNHSKQTHFADHLADLATWSSLFWSTLGSPQAITITRLVELRLLSLQSSLCASTHGRLSLKSLALVAHLDCIEDTSDHTQVNSSVQPTTQVEITLPLFHRCLVQWTAIAQNVTIAHLNVETASDWLSSLHAELLSVDAGTSNLTRPQFKELTTESIAALSVMRSEAMRQWQRATHSLTSHRTGDSLSTSIPTSTTQQCSATQTGHVSRVASPPPDQPIKPNQHNDQKPIARNMRDAAPSSFQSSPSQLSREAAPLISSLHPTRRYPSSSDILDLARQQVQQSDSRSSNQTNSHLLRSSQNPLVSSSANFHSHYVRPLHSTLATSPLTISPAPSSGSTSSIIDRLQSLEIRHSVTNARDRKPNSSHPRRI